MTVKNTVCRVIVLISRNPRKNSSSKRNIEWKSRFNPDKTAQYKDVLSQRTLTNLAIPGKRKLNYDYYFIIKGGHNSATYFLNKSMTRLLDVQTP